MRTRAGIVRVGIVIVALLLAVFAPPAAHGTGVNATARQIAGAPQWPFYRPSAIAKIGRNLYVLEENAIARYDMNTQSVDVVAGAVQASGSADGVGGNARFSGPQGITTDGTDLYVADTLNNTIRKVTLATRQVTTIAGLAGVAGVSDGTGSAARFNGPAGVATAAGTAVWITDTGNFTIRKLTLSTGAVTTLAGSAGMSGSADGTGAAARFTTPKRIVVGPYGRVYVSDGVKLRSVKMKNGFVTTLATLTQPGYLVRLNGLTSTGDSIYVASAYDDDEGDIIYSDLRRVNAATGAVSAFANGGRGATGLTVNGDATKLFAVDWEAGPYFYKENIASQVATDLSDFRATGHVNGTGRAARFDFPPSVATDGAKLYVIDGRDIRKVDPVTGVVTTLAANVLTGVVGKDIVRDGGDLYVGDANVVRKVVIATGAVSTVATLDPNRWVNALTVAGSELFIGYTDCTLYRVPITGGTPTVFAGSPGNCASVDGTGTAARFGDAACGVACAFRGMDNDGAYIYLSDLRVLRKVNLATAQVTTIQSTQPIVFADDVAYASGKLYLVGRVQTIAKLPVSGGTYKFVTSEVAGAEPFDYSVNLASETYVEGAAGITASADGHRVYFTTATGVGAIED